MFNKTTMINQNNDCYKIGTFAISSTSFLFDKFRRLWVIESSNLLCAMMSDVQMTLVVPSCKLYIDSDFHHS